MKETELYYSGRETEETSDMNCQILEEVLSRVHAISFPTILDLHGANEND